MSSLLLLIFALKATIVFGTALIATLLARRGSAAFRHQLWMLAIVGALSFPALHSVLPAWRAPVISERLQALTSGLQSRASQALPRTGGFVVNAVPAKSGVSDWIVGLWAISAALFCLRMLVGLLGLAKRSARSRELSDERFALALKNCSRALKIARPVRLLIATDENTMPCTWGVRRPAILLPANCREWPADRIRMVLNHELAHISRLDWLTHLVADACVALYWFHPLAWLAFQKLKEESERACDDVVLMAGEDAAQYASDLLQIVRNAKRSGRLPATALAVARPTHLERRFTAMLDETLNRQRPTRKATALTSTATLLFLLPVAAFHSSAQTASGRFSGRVVDPRGTSVAAATIVLSNRAAHTRDMTASDASGAFHFDQLPAGEYEMRVLKPGFSESRRSVALNQARDTAEEVKLEMGPISEQIGVQAAIPSTVLSSAPTRLTINTQVQAASLIHKVTPVYPASAKAGRQQGAVVLEAVIGPDGVPSSLQVINGQIDADLAKAAVEAVSQWRYRPTLLNGQPIAVQTDITVNFTLVE